MSTVQPCTDTEKRDPNNKRCRESKPILAHNAPSSSEKQIELVEGFFPQPSINVLGGESGLGKSPLAIQLAVCVAAGLPFLGMPVKQGIVLYCDYENYGAFWPMVDEISAALGCRADRMICINSSSRPMSGSIRRLPA